MDNGQNNIVSFMEKLPTHYIDRDGEFRWRLIGSKERAIPLVKASSDATGSTTPSASSTFGKNRTPFYLWFSERYFTKSSTLAGRHPELYRLICTEDAVQVGSLFRYKVELVTGDDTLFVPYEDLIAPAKFAELYGLVSPTLSKDGNDVHFGTHSEFANTTTYIRKKHEVPGNMIDAGKNVPLIYPFQGENGKKEFVWIDYLGWEFMNQFRQDKAKLLLYGMSNKLADGSYANKDSDGETIRSGFGLYEQMNGGNIMPYNSFSVDILTDFLMQISVGKLPEDKREFILSTGEWGWYQFHKALKREANNIQWLWSDVNLMKQVGGGLKYNEAQFAGAILVNGIKVNILLDPMKDSWVINQITHPQGGLAQSYVYDIWDVGTTNGEPNVMKVAVKGMEEYFAYIPGMRDPFTPGSPLKPKLAATPVDGYRIDKMFIGGLVIKNPLKTGRIIPTQLQ